MLGKRLEVLLEKIYPHHGCTWGEGFSGNYTLVRFPLKTETAVGKIIPVTAKEALSWGVIGDSL
jgi:hypothetical protein